MKKIQVTLTAMAFVFAIAGAYGSKVLVADIYQSSASSGSSCSEFGNLPSHCTKTTQDAQCRVNSNNTGNFLFDGINTGTSTCITPVYRVQ